MQFRIMTNKLQFIRSLYDPARKRCYQKMIASISKNEISKISYPVDLTAKEISEYIEWFEKYEESQRLSMLRLRFENAAASINEITQAIENEEINLNITICELNDIYISLKSLRKVLLKNGVKPSNLTKTKRKQIDKHDDGQLDFFDVNSY